MSTRVHNIKWYNWTGLMAVVAFMIAGVALLIGVYMGVTRGATDDAKGTAYIAAQYQCPVSGFLYEGQFYPNTKVGYETVFESEE